MSETAKLRDDDYIDRLFSVSKGIRVPKNGGGYVTTYLTSGTKAITADGVYDVNEYASVNVTAGSVAGSALIGVLDGSATQLTADQLAGLTTLRDSAFVHMTDLASIVFPEGLVTIGNYVCDDCNSLASVTFPSTLESMFQKNMIVISYQSALQALRHLETLHYIFQWIA